jgi:hypothetical protein
MTPRDKLHWFWVTGVLPGSIFDDWNDGRSRRTEGDRQPHRRSAGRRPMGAHGGTASDKGKKG